MYTVQTAAPVQHTAAERATKRARHFFHDGKDTFQTSSPKLKVAASAPVLQAFRQQQALKQQQATISSQDHAFISSLFHTDIPYDTFLEAVDL